MREELVRIIAILQRVQPRQLPLCVPSQGSLIAVPVIDVDFDVGSVGAASGNKERTRVATNIRGGGGEVGGCAEAYVQEAIGMGRLTLQSPIEEVGVERGRGEKEMQFGGREACYSQSSHGIAKWIGGGVIRNGPRKARSVHI